jgi:predicted DNA-binding transcriptional regulator AlpA
MPPVESSPAIENKKDRLGTEEDFPELAEARRQIDKRSADFSGFPSEQMRNRILNSAQAASYAGFSVVHWRRLCRAGRAPPPIRIGARKCGWRLSDLEELIASRMSEV